MHRFSAIGMLGLMPTTVITGSAASACALSVMMPYHFSLGVESLIDDYIHNEEIKVRAWEQQQWWLSQRLVAPPQCSPGDETATRRDARLPHSGPNGRA